MRARRLIAVSAAIAALSAGCGGGEPDSPPPSPTRPQLQAPDAQKSARAAKGPRRATQVAMLDLRFAPLDVTVKPRGRVTFVNSGRVTHNAKGPGFFTRVVEPADEKTIRAPRTTGRHSYVCTFHPGMRARLTVRD